MTFKDKLTIISNDLNCGEINESEAIIKLCDLMGVGYPTCKHDSTYIVPGVFGGRWCYDCKEKIEIEE